MSPVGGFKRSFAWDDHEGNHKKADVRRKMGQVARGHLGAFRGNLAQPFVRVAAQSGVPTKIDYGKKKATLMLSSLLEECLEFGSWDFPLWPLLGWASFLGRRGNFPSDNPHTAMDGHGFGSGGFGSEHAPERVQRHARTGAMNFPRHGT